MEKVQEVIEELRKFLKSPEFNADVASNNKNLNVWITDLYYSYEDVEKKPGAPPEWKARQAKTFFGYVQKLFKMIDFTPWIVMALLGILTAAAGLILDFLIVYAYNTRLRFIKDVENPVWSFIQFWVSGFIMVTIATSISKYVIQWNDGSGVPEMRSILSGANTYKYLDSRIIFAKMIGLTTAYGGGMALGKTGPLIHISGSIAQWLLKREMFKHIDKNLSMKRSILCCAVGASVCAGMGTPVAAIIMSIELTYGTYNVSNLFRTVVCICWAMIASKIIGNYIYIDPLVRTNFPPYELGWDLITFAIVGLVVGLLIVAVLKAATKLTYLRRVTKYRIFERYNYIWMGFTIITILNFAFQYSLGSNRVFYNDTFTSGELEENPRYSESPLWTLVAVTLIQMISGALTFSSNVPFGIFGPATIIGCMTGRLIGEIGARYGLFVPQAKGAYAVVGTAAGLACVARTLSPMIMLVEMTGQIEFGLPNIVATLVAYIVGNFFAMSFFDVAIYLRKLPIVPSLMDDDKYEKTARDLMTSHYYWLTQDSDHKDAFQLFAKSGEINKALTIPVLTREGHLVGAVKNEHLIKYLEEMHLGETRELLSNIQERKKSKKSTRIGRIEQFFSRTRSIYERETHDEGDSRIVKSQLFEMSSMKQSSSGAYDDPVDKFLHSKIDWKHPTLRFDPSPLMVTPECYASKVQYLIAVTKATSVYVMESGKLLGIIRTNEFLKFKA